MATKNLSRTVIEGGRCSDYKREVHERIREERAGNRVFLRDVALDPESWEDDCASKRKPVTPCFADKINPIRRFLDSRVGQSWDAVRSELFDKFDTRTTPGRHVLFDHLLADVCEGTEKEELRFKRYRVDGQGRLAKIEDDGPRFRGSWIHERYRENLFHVAAWLGNRKVGRCGAGFVWFVPTTSSNEVRAVFERWEIVYAFVDAAGSPLRTPILASAAGRYFDSRNKGPIVLARCSFRQADKLSAREEAFFRGISAEWQEKILKLAPANV